MYDHNVNYAVNRVSTCLELIDASKAKRRKHVRLHLKGHQHWNKDQQFISSVCCTEPTFVIISVCRPKRAVHDASIVVYEGPLNTVSGKLRPKHQRKHATTIVTKLDTKPASNLSVRWLRKLPVSISPMAIANKLCSIINMCNHENNKCSLTTLMNQSPPVNQTLQLKTCKRFTVSKL